MAVRQGSDDELLGTVGQKRVYEDAEADPLLVAEVGSVGLWFLDRFQVEMGGDRAVGWQIDQKHVEDEEADDEDEEGLV